MKKLLCPILTIGFEPPKGKEKLDVRECSEHCAWFDEDNDQCSIKTCAERTQLLSDLLDELISMETGFTETINDTL